MPKRVDPEFVRVISRKYIYTFTSHQYLPNVPLYPACALNSRSSPLLSHSCPSLLSLNLPTPSTFKATNPFVLSALLAKAKTLSGTPVMACLTFVTILLLSFVLDPARASTRGWRDSPREMSPGDDTCIFFMGSKGRIGRLKSVIETEEGLRAVLGMACAWITWTILSSAGDH